MAAAARIGILLAAIFGLTIGCAPASVKAQGPIADEVTAALSSGTDTFAHQEWSRLLAGGIREGLVDYDYFQEHREELDDYLDRIAEVELSGLSSPHLMALLCNAYNALTIRSILNHPTVSSIRDIPGVWKRTTHRVGGHDLTLDQIEHNILRPFFQDPRVHFAINCASASCAPLPPWAFTGEKLEEQLDGRARDFLRDPRNVRVEDGRLVLSKYFDWFADDFVGAEWDPRADTIGSFVALYADDEVASFIQSSEGQPPISFVDYDWSLNDAPSE